MKLDFPKPELPPLYPKLNYPSNKVPINNKVQFIIDCGINFNKQRRASPYFITAQSDEPS